MVASFELRGENSPAKGHSSSRTPEGIRGGSTVDTRYGVGLAVQPSGDGVNVKRGVLRGGSPDSAAELLEEAGSGDLILRLDEVQVSATIEDDVSDRDSHRLTVEAPDLVSRDHAIHDSGVKELVSEVRAASLLFLEDFGVDDLTHPELLPVAGHSPPCRGGDEDGIAKSRDDILGADAVHRVDEYQRGILETHSRYASHKYYLLLSLSIVSAVSVIPTIPN